MELRRLSSGDFLQVKQVWKQCFADSDEFISAYFNSAAKIGQGFGIFEQDRLLSDLFMLDFNASVSGVVFNTAFVAGCATVPEARHKHLMQTLIKQALLHMKEQGIAVSFLHPFLHAFYRKFGYETVAYVREYEEIPKPETVKQKAVVYQTAAQLPAEAMQRSYMAYTRQFDSYFIRNSARMDAWIKLLFSDGGYAAVLPGDSKQPAYALYYTDGEQANIFELVFFSAQQKADLIHSLPVQKCRYFLPIAGKTADAEEFTMMRVINPRVMLRRYPYPEQTPDFVINIHDEFLGEDYNLHVAPGATDAAVEEIDAQSDIVTDINGLAALLAGTYDRKLHAQAEPVFRVGSNCYFETY